MKKVFGACAFLILDEEKDRLWVKKSLNNDFSTVHFSFDPSKPAPPFKKWADYMNDHHIQKYTFMNKVCDFFTEY